MNPLALVRPVLLTLTLLSAASGPCAAASAVAGSIGIVTIVDGSAQIVRDTVRFAATEGLRVQAEDLVLTAPDSRVVRVEMSDGSVLDLGPASQAQLQPQPLPDRPATVYLAAGWAKLTSRPGQSVAGIASPRLDLLQLTGAAVLQAGPQRAVVFVESGRADLSERGAEAAPRALALREGESYVLRGAAPGAMASRPSAALLQGLPRALADQLPRRAPRFQSTQVAPGAATPVSYAEVALWINGEAALRAGFVQRFAPLARDRAFRAPLLAELRTHPEWRRVLFPEQLAKARAAALAKAAAKAAPNPSPEAETAAAPARQAAPALAVPAAAGTASALPATGLPPNAALVETWVVRAN